MNTPTSPDHVFVYGTLKRGHGNHRVMQMAGGELVGTAMTVERFPLVVEGLPYLLDRSGSGHRVIGEIYRVPDSEGWYQLDRLEGHPRFYRRRAIACEVDGVFMSAWAYFLQGDYNRFAHLTPVREYSRNLEFS